MADEQPTRYIIVETERAEIDRDNAYLFLLSRNGPEYAHEWLRGLIERIQSLAAFPGPFAYAVDEPASARHGMEIRRMTYRSSRRSASSGTVYRILYSVRPPTAPAEEGIIQVIRILHAAQDPDAPSEQES